MSFVTMELAREIENDRILEQLTNKIKKIVPDIDGYYNSGLYKVLDDNGKEIKDFFSRPITLEDILRCLENNERLGEYGISNGYFTFYDNDGDDIGEILFDWQLGKPLHEQSEDTIKELNNLI